MSMQITREENIEASILRVQHSVNTKLQPNFNRIHPPLWDAKALKKILVHNFRNMKVTG